MCIDVGLLAGCTIFIAWCLFCIGFTMFVAIKEHKAMDSDPPKLDP